MKTLRKILLCVLVVCAAFLFVGCDKCNGEEQPSVTSGTINIKQSEVQLDVYESTSLEYVITNSTEKPTWSVSDSSVISVDQNGIVIALKSGAATVTATLGSASDSCTVTVVSTGSVPALSVNKDKIEIADDAEFDLISVVTYKGKEVTGATINYSVVSGTDVVSVDADGKVKALKTGNALIYVTASWQGISAETSKAMEKTVEVIVKKVVSFEIDKTFYELYTADVVGDETFLHEESLDLVVYNNGQAVGAECIEWAPIDNSGIVEVSGNTLIGKKEGTTKAKYTVTVEGEVLLEGVVDVKVNLPVVYSEKTITLERKELVVGDDNTYSFEFKEYTISAEEIFGTGTQETIVKIFDSEQNVIGENGVIESLEDISTTNEGTTYIGVGNGQYILFVNAIIADTVIDSNAKFLTHMPLIKEGYVILSTNIDITELGTGTTPYQNYLNRNDYKAWSGRVYPQGKNVSTAYVNINGTAFSGHFDGRGYSIKGLALGSTSGLFGFIKNCKLENFSYYPASVAEGDQTGLICTTVYSSTSLLFKNIYINFDIANKAESTKLGIVSGGTNETVVIENCVFDIYDSGASETSRNNFALASVAVYYSHYATPKNTYFIYNGDGAKTVNLKGGEQDSRFSKYFENCVFQTRQACVDYIAENTFELETFNEYWDVSGDIPVFKTKA